MAFATIAMNLQAQKTNANILGRLVSLLESIAAHMQLAILPQAEKCFVRWHVLQALSVQSAGYAERPTRKRCRIRCSVTAKKYASVSLLNTHCLAKSFVVANAARSHCMAIYDRSGKNAIEGKI